MQNNGDSRRTGNDSQHAVFPPGAATARPKGCQCHGRLQADSRTMDANKGTRMQLCALPPARAPSFRTGRRSGATEGEAGGDGGIQSVSTLAVTRWDGVGEAAVRRVVAVVQCTVWD